MQIFTALFDEVVPASNLTPAVVDSRDTTGRFTCARYLAPAFVTTCTSAEALGLGRVAARTCVCRSMIDNAQHSKPVWPSGKALGG